MSDRRTEYELRGADVRLYNYMKYNWINVFHIYSITEMKYKWIHVFHILYIDLEDLLNKRCENQFYD